MAGSVNTREKIYQKALDLFSKESYESVSILNITQAVGISKASFYNHFVAPGHPLVYGDGCYRKGR